MLVKALLIASSLMMADGRQQLRNQEERSLGWAGDGNTAVPIKVVKKPVNAVKMSKGSGKKKTLVVRKKRSKPSSAKAIKINESKGKVASVRPIKKWGDDGFEPITTPRPTRKPISKRWGDDGFEPIVTPRPSRRPSPKPTKWGNDGHCMYRPNADFSMCTNDDDISSDYMYNTLEGCCRALFGKGECEYEDVCEPCEEQLFFYDGEICSNDIFIADAPAYGSAVACCNMNFGLGSFVNGDCDYVNVCLPEPVVTPAPTPCGDLLFFKDGNTCTNDIFIADTVAYSEFDFDVLTQECMSSLLLQSSYLACFVDNPLVCCNVNFGPGSIMNGDCDVIDICGPPPTPKPTKKPTRKPVPSPVTPAPTVCEDIMFYYDGSICTNEIYISDTAAYGKLHMHMACRKTYDYVNAILLMND